MSDDEADPELLELLRQSLGISNRGRNEVSSDTGVFKDAQYIYNNAIDVSIDMYGTKNAATLIHQSMQERSYSTETWSQHELHPKRSEGFSDLDIVNFIFTMDLLNFSFWSDRSESERYQVEYKGKRWTGYWSLVACLRRALDEDVPITTPRFWSREGAMQKVRGAFRSATDEDMPMLHERLAVLVEAAKVLDEMRDDDDRDTEHDSFNSAPAAADGEAFKADDTPIESAVPAQHDAVSGDAGAPIAEQADALAASSEQTDPASDIQQPPVVTESQTAASEESDAQSPTVNDTRPPTEDRIIRPDESVVRLIEQAKHSAGRLVNLLAKHFPCFRDESRFDGKRVRLLKRAQIFVADLWAAFNETGYGEFDDIDSLTMFADYRVPQMLHSLGVLTYAPALEYRIRDLKEIPSGHSWEVQLRGCSIWAVELIRREIMKQHPDTEVNAVLIDFFLYDLAKERERVQGGLAVPHHRTRSIWY